MIDSEYDNNDFLFEGNLHSMVVVVEAVPNLLMHFAGAVILAAN